MEEHDSPQTELRAEIERLRARVGELEQDSARLEALLTNLTSTVVVGDAEGRFAYVSPQVREMFGLEPDELVGQLCFEWIHPDDLPILMEAMVKAVAGEPVFDVEYRVRHAQGQYVHISAAGRLVSEGGDVHLVGVLTDITRRVQADERLRRLSTALEQSTDALVLCDLTGVIVEANAAALELFGADRGSDLVGHNSLEFVSPEDTEKAARDMATLMEEGRVKGVETRFRNFRGDEMLLELNMSVIADAAGAPSGIAGVLRDRTAQRRTEEELLKARKLESIGLLAGGIAHDFNNVLSAILGNLNVARARCEPGHRALAPLVDAEKATLRARRLTQRLLTFSHGGEPIKASVRLAVLLDAAVDQALPEGAPRPTIDLPEGIWAAEADAGQVQQALEHLLRNAVESGGLDTPVTIRARNVQMAEDIGSLAQGRYVHIAFEDRGPAIPPERRADVFDPYFSTKNTDSALALATAFSIASRHGGTITVESAPDGGSVFALYLPASLSPTQEHALKPIQVAGEGRRVLVMDDEKMVCQVARRMLEALGFEVTLAADGLEAIARYQEARAGERPFHAVLLDLTVPTGLGGRETLERLRALDPDVKAIVASGYSDDPVMAHFAEHGFRAVLTKPYQLSELAAALRRAL